jgi:hypothetical protein
MGRATKHRIGKENTIALGQGCRFSMRHIYTVPGGRPAN